MIEANSAQDEVYLNIWHPQHCHYIGHACHWIKIWVTSQVQSNMSGAVMVYHIMMHVQLIKIQLYANRREIMIDISLFIPSLDRPAKKKLTTLHWSIDISHFQPPEGYLNGHRINWNDIFYGTLICWDQASLAGVTQSYSDNVVSTSYLKQHVAI